MTQQIDLEAIAAMAHRATTRANVRAVSADMERAKELCADAQNLAAAVLELVERVRELEAAPVMPEVPDGKLLLSAGAMVDAHPANVLGFFEAIRSALLK